MNKILIVKKDGIFTSKILDKFIISRSAVYNILLSYSRSSLDKLEISKNEYLQLQKRLIKLDNDNLA